MIQAERLQQKAIDKIEKKLTQLKRYCAGKDFDFAVPEKGKFSYNWFLKFDINKEALVLSSGSKLLKSKSKYHLKITDALTSCKLYYKESTKSTSTYKSELRNLENELKRQKQMYEALALENTRLAKINSELDVQQHKSSQELKKLREKLVSRNVTVIN